MPQMTPLKQARQDKGLKSLDVAAAIGITEQYYSEIENGRTPSFRLARRISLHLGMPMRLLFSAFDVNEPLRSGERAPASEHEGGESKTASGTTGV